MIAILMMKTIHWRVLFPFHYDRLHNDGAGCCGFLFPHHFISAQLSITSQANNVPICKYISSE